MADDKQPRPVDLTSYDRARAMYELNWVCRFGPNLTSYSAESDVYVDLPTALRAMAVHIEHRKGIDIHLELRSRLSGMVVFKWNNY